LSKNPDYVLAVGDNHFFDEHGTTCYWDERNQVVYDKADAAFLSFGDKLKQVRKEIDFDSPTFGEYSTFFKGNYVPNGYLFDREVFAESIGGYAENAPLEDLYLHFQLAKHGKYKYIDTPLFYYRRHSGNFSVNRLKMVEISWQTFLLEEEYALNNGHKAEYERFKKRHLETLQSVQPAPPSLLSSLKLRLKKLLK
jgi:hypothetical protein